MSRDVLCPSCGGVAARQETRYGRRDMCCGLWSWDGKPLQSAATHDARKAAHEVFDAIWKSGRISRSTAYRELAVALSIPAKDCHIALFDEDTALKVVEIARTF